MAGLFQAVTYIAASIVMTLGFGTRPSRDVGAATTTVSELGESTLGATTGHAAGGGTQHWLGGVGDGIGGLLLLLGQLLQFLMSEQFILILILILFLQLTGIVKKFVGS